MKRDKSDHKFDLLDERQIILFLLARKLFKKTYFKEDVV